MSWNLGVKPARTTLLEEAMHSMTSGWVVSGVLRDWGDRGGEDTSAEVGVDVVGFEEHCFADI